MLNLLPIMYSCSDACARTPTCACLRMRVSIYTDICLYVYGGAYI